MQVGIYQVAGLVVSGSNEEGKYTARSSQTGRTLSSACLILIFCTCDILVPKLVLQACGSF
jgi:hypothetical protein